MSLMTALKRYDAYVRIGAVFLVAAAWFSHATMPTMLFGKQYYPGFAGVRLDIKDIFGFVYEYVFLFFNGALCLSLVPRAIIKPGGISRLIVGTALFTLCCWAFFEIWMALVGNDSVGIMRIYATLWHGGRSLVLLMIVTGVRIVIGERASSSALG